jgi:hypothetical protein
LPSPSFAWTVTCFSLSLALTTASIA